MAKQKLLEIHFNPQAINSGLGVALLAALAALAFFALVWATGSMAPLGFAGCGPYAGQRQDPAYEIQAAAHYAACDLVAQESVAASTRALLLLAIPQLVLAIAGTLLVLRSLRFNREAVQAARDATEVTLKIGQEQARAYVDAAYAQIFGDGPTLVVRVTLRNSGATPAVSVLLFAATEVIDGRAPVFPPRFHLVSRGFPWGSLRSGAEYPVPIEDGRTEQHFYTVQAADGPLSLRAYGCVRYTTIFGETYESEFSFHTNNTRLLFKKGSDGMIVDDPIMMKGEPGEFRSYHRVTDSRPY